MNTINNAVQSEVDSAAQPAITFLNMTGDITISWDAENRDAVLALVEEKMRQGYSFFIMKPRLFGLLGHTKHRAGSIDAIAKHGKVVMADEEAARILDKTQVNDAAVEGALARGQIRLVGSEVNTSIDTVRRAKDPHDVVQHQSVAVRRIVGG